MSLASLQADLEEAYTRYEKKKIAISQILDMPVGVAARDEASGATIYGGDFGTLSSSKQNRK